MRGRHRGPGLRRRLVRPYKDGMVVRTTGEELQRYRVPLTVIGGVEHRWSTVGLYRIREERMAACWLLPLDAEDFDIWACHRPTSDRSVHH